MVFDSSHRIRPACESDIPQIVSLLGEVQLATYVGVTPEITREVILYHISGDWPQRKEAEFRERIDTGRARMWAAHYGGRVVGYCMAALDRQGGALGVHPEYQGGFVGPRLLHAAGESLGVQDDTYLTVVPGTAAVRFYAQLGFLPTGRDITADFPRLRGGEILPQIELVLRQEDAKYSLARFGLLLSRRDHAQF